MRNAEKWVSSMRQPLSDEDLLTADDPEAFGVFYARHLRSIERFFARRVSGHEAYDLAAETFAAAFEARRRFVPGRAPATAWLFTIAARRLIDFRRRGAVEQRSLTGSRWACTPRPRARANQPTRRRVRSTTVTCATSRANSGMRSSRISSATSGTRRSHRKPRPRNSPCGSGFRADSAHCASR
jgi:DNA-directed RNA polymerase specialized sigma24 family protein